MSKQSFKSKAINAVLTAISDPSSFFFLVIGDKTCVDVAWSNTEDLECDGAFAIASDPKSAGAFYNLSCSVDLLIEDNVKNKEFDAVFQKTSPTKDDTGWYSLEEE